MARHISNVIYRSAADMDTDVLIVGGGPTGLMLANQLGRRGIHAMIVDRHSGPAQQTRAMAVHARTLEIYSKLGIAERALELGKQGDGANMWAEGKRSARIPIGDMGRSLSPFPFVLMLGQDDNERIMGEHLRKYGVAVQWNTELVSFEQSSDRVTATLGHHVSRRALRARVLRCRHRGDRIHGAGRAERLPVARRIPPVLPDARDRPLARHRHPARASARKARSHFRGDGPRATKGDRSGSPL